jgi:hypothetical protein
MKPRKGQVNDVPPKVKISLFFSSLSFFSPSLPLSFPRGPEAQLGPEVRRSATYLETFFGPKKWGVDTTCLADVTTLGPGMIHTRKQNSKDVLLPR